VKVLVTRTDRLGDLVLSLPVLAYLKNARPDWEIHVMVAPAATALVRNDPHIARVWTWRDDFAGAERRDLVAELRAEGFTVAVLLQYRRELASLLGQAGITHRYGPWSKWSSWFQLNRGLRQNRSAGGRHEMDFNLELAEHLLSDYDSDTGWNVQGPRLYLDADQQQATRDFRGEFGLDGVEVVFIHPGSGGSALDWDTGRFAAVANGLAAPTGRRVFVTGALTDAGVVGEVAAHLDPAVTVLLDRYRLAEFLAVLAAGDLFIGPSTGPLHMAAALSVPTVGLFPPLRTMHPDRWGPRGMTATQRHNLVPEVDCPWRHHCRRERCAHFNCMADIQVETVLATARGILARGKA